MKYIKLTVILAYACISLLVGACISAPDDKDMTMPFIEESEESYPQQCEVYPRGGFIPLRCTFSDDMELGNFNVEIHNNFDHHSHSTSSVECDYDEHDDHDDHDDDHDHEAAHDEETDHDHDHDHDLYPNAWVFNQDYSIPAGQTLYKASIDIPIPEDISEGDYHFMIRLTDRAGWQQLKSVSIKIGE
ncbi:MAG: DUF4625 domain-containing protein [Prevotella sp.]|nr:DUF4625 domain-containing protein [Prevotella sp.]